MDEKLAAMYQSKSVLVWKDLPPLDIHLTNESRISDVIKQVQTKIFTLKTDIENIQHEQLHLKASEKLESLAAALSDGEACPLCGATHHPSVMQISEIRAVLKNLDTRLAQHKKNIKTLENIENQLITLNINFNNETEARRQTAIKITDEKQKLSGHQQKFAWSPYSPTDYSIVEKALNAAADFDHQMRKLEEAFLNFQKNKEVIENDIEKYRKGISDYESKKAAKESAVQILRSQIGILDFESTLLKSETTLKSHAEGLEKQYITIENEFHLLEKNVQKIQSEVQILRGGIDELTQAKSALEQAESNHSATLNEKIQASQFGNLDIINSILTSKLNVPQVRQKLNEFKNQLLLITSRLVELNKKLEGKPYSSENHHALIADIQIMEQNLQIQNQTVGEIKSDILDKTKRLEQFNQTEKQLLAHNNRAENLKILRGLFQRSGFVNFASSVFLESIIRAANERFTKLTKQQLELRITENNNFIVCDKLNEGRLRDVRTLSGGQTFQAALCLALALSDHIQSRHQARQNFFFLDEGFGSLDRESLQTVFETLKALRKENRIVGIISHVEDMRLEIDRYLNVSLSETNGSEVELVIG